MSRRSAVRGTWKAILVVAASACGSGAGSAVHPATEPPATSSSPAEDTFGPLEVGADYASMHKLTDKPFLSLDHGNRWVDVYANELGAEPYLHNADIPVGAIFVKTSFQGVDGVPSEIAGPIFVMEKRAPGYAPETGDWWYAIHWAEPPPQDAAKFGGPIYWRGKSKRVQYCLDCHDSYNNSLGGLVPSSILKR